MATLYTAEQVGQIAYCAVLAALTRVSQGASVAEAMRQAETEADRLPSDIEGVLDAWEVDRAALEA